MGHLSETGSCRFHLLKKQGNLIHNPPDHSEGHSTRRAVMLPVSANTVHKY